MTIMMTEPSKSKTLNESPSEKEGKSRRSDLREPWCPPPSMKVPPKRKGNQGAQL